MVAGWVKIAVKWRPGSELSKATKNVIFHCWRSIVACHYAPNESTQIHLASVSLVPVQSDIRVQLASRKSSPGRSAVTLTCSRSLTLSQDEEQSSFNHKPTKKKSTSNRNQFTMRNMHTLIFSIQSPETELQRTRASQPCPMHVLEQ